MIAAGFVPIVITAGPCPHLLTGQSEECGSPTLAQCLHIVYCTAEQLFIWLHLAFEGHCASICGRLRYLFTLVLGSIEPTYSHATPQASCPKGSLRTCTADVVLLHFHWSCRFDNTMTLPVLSCIPACTGCLVHLPVGFTEQGPADHPWCPPACSSAAGWLSFTPAA